MLNLKVRVLFYLADFLRTSSLGRSISDNTEKIVLKGQGEGSRIYRVFCNKRLGNQNIKRLLLIKADQTSQVNAFRAFLCVGGCKRLGSLESSLSQASQPSWPSILCFRILSCLGAHRREWLQPDDGYSPS